MCVAAVPRYLLWHPALAVPRTLVDAAVLQHDDVADAVAVWWPVERAQLNIVLTRAVCGCLRRVACRVRRQRRIPVR
jgi:hypothetical protein